MKKNITILDYGSGNILSAKQSFLRVIKNNDLDAEVNISAKPESINKIGKFSSKVKKVDVLK